MTTGSPSMTTGKGGEPGQSVSATYMNRSNIAAQMDELIQQNELLLKENDFLQSFIDRYENDDELDMNDNVDEDFEPVLTPQMKLSIAQLEAQNLEKERIGLNKQFLDTAITQKSLILSTEQKLSQLRRLMFQFQREVLNDQQLTGNFVVDENGVEKIVHQLPKSVNANSLQAFYTKQTNALKVQGEQLAKNKGAQVDKYNKLEKQLSKPQQQGNTITQVDFEQLRIENEKLQDKVATRNQEMLRIKLNAGNCMRLLNEYKAELHRALDKKRTQDTDVTAKQYLIKQLDERLGETRKALTTDSKNLQVLRQKEIGAQDGPQGVDYLSLKVMQATLEKAVKEAKRKIGIKEREIQNIQAGAK